MKTIFKILVIVVVAVLVGGLFYGIVTASSSDSSQSSMTERQPPAGGEFDRPDQADADGLQFPVDSVKNLAIISIISVIYLNASRWLDRKKPTANVVQ